MAEWSAVGQSNEPYLVLSDLQIPFEAEKALEFARYVKRHFKVPNDNCLNVGDETDQFHGSLYEKDGDYELTPKAELRIAKEKLQEWYAAFPKMKLAISNHGIRWVRKAAAVQMPSEILRTYEEIIESPKEWRWADRWTINASKQKFILTHGMEYGGMYAYRQAPTTEGCSVVFGHLHSSAGIAYVKSANQNIWGFNTGCLIDPDAFAFKYGKWNKWKPNLGIGVVLQGGRQPVWIPYE